jgi:hypothetical protein
LPAKYKNCFEILPALSLRRNMWSTISGLWCSFTQESVFNSRCK